MLPQHDAHRSPRGADQDHDNQGQASDEESDVQDTTRAPTEGGMIQYEAPHERPRSTLIGKHRYDCIFRYFADDRTSH